MRGGARPMRAPLPLSQEGHAKIKKMLQKKKKTASKQRDIHIFATNLCYNFKVYRFFFGMVRNF